MKANGLSSIVAYDAVDGWTYRLKLFEKEGKHYIGGELIVCGYDDTLKKYTLVDGTENDSVTKVRNLPCFENKVSQSVVEDSMSTFLNNLMTDYYGIDKATAKLRTDKVDDGSGLTYDDLEVSVWIIDEA